MMTALMTAMTMTMVRAYDGDDGGSTVAHAHYDARASATNVKYILYAKTQLNMDPLTQMHMQI